MTTYLEVASTAVWPVPAAFLPASYLDAVTRAGGIGVLLPPQPVSALIAARVVEQLDGLVFTGGRDIDPARYTMVPHPRSDSPRLDCDVWEAALQERAIERDLPFLGICRGAQLLNVVRGGTLHQHLPDVIGTDSYQTGDGVYGSVGVVVPPGSRLHALLGPDAALPASVPVYHHRAIDALGSGLTVSARATDGIVQAIALAGATLGIAVQWHPEEQADALFDATYLLSGAADIALNNAGISRPTTPRSSRQSCRPGTACRTSTSPRCTCARVRRCAIRPGRAADRSSTARVSWP